MSLDERNEFVRPDMNDDSKQPYMRTTGVRASASASSSQKCACGCKREYTRQSKKPFTRTTGVRSYWTRSTGSLQRVRIGEGASAVRV